MAKVKKEIKTEQVKTHGNMKESIKELTAYQLHMLTGKSYRTVTMKLQSVKASRVDKVATYYSPRLALDAIYESDTDKGFVEDEAKLLKEKLKSETYRAEKARMEVELLRKESLPVDVVERIWTRMITTFRAKILSIPTKVSLQLVGEKDVRTIEGKIRQADEEALNELKEFTIEDYSGFAEESGVTSSATTEADNKRVGRRGKNAQPRE